MDEVDKNFHILPRNAVISVFETEEALRGVLATLREAGFTSKNLQYRHGEEGLKLIDPDGSHHNFWTRLLRSYQRLGGPEAQLLEQVEAALKNDEYALRVDTDGSEAQRDAAFEAMHTATDNTIFYTGSGTITILHMGENYFNTDEE